MSDEGFLLSPDNLPQYLAGRGLAKRGGVRACALGGGVSNIVLLIEWANEPYRRWVAKQSLGKLRVKDDWRSDRGRIFREAKAIQALRPLLGDSVPEVIYIDRENYLFIMTAAPMGSLAWKELLLGRRADLATAHQVAELLARIINGSRVDPWGYMEFSDRTVFDQLRIDPYYRTAAGRHPDVATALGELIADSWKIQTALVHGDYSPKNILVRGHKVVLIDFEVAHCGDPSFDSGFLLNHLFLKAFHQPVLAKLYLEAAMEFWKTLCTALGPETGGEFELLTIRHLGALLLARIDGKSPVEYIQDECTKERVRHAAKRILLERPARLEEVLGLVQAETGGGR